MDDDVAGPPMVKRERLSFDYQDNNNNNGGGAAADRRAPNDPWEYTPNNPTIGQNSAHRNYHPPPPHPYGYAVQPPAASGALATSQHHYPSPRGVASRHGGGQPLSLVRPAGAGEGRAAAAVPAASSPNAPPIVSMYYPLMPLSDYYAAGMMNAAHRPPPSALVPLMPSSTHKLIQDYRQQHNNHYQAHNNSNSGATERGGAEVQAATAIRRKIPTSPSTGSPLPGPKRPSFGQNVNTDHSERTVPAQQETAAQPRRIPSGRQLNSTTASKNSYYCGYGNFQPVPPAHTAPVSTCSAAQPAAAPVPLQPLRQHNVAVSPQPLVPRTNVYTTGQENIAPSAPKTPASDKQLLRARFAQRGILLDQTVRIGSGRYSKVMTAGMRDGSTIAIKVINTNRVTSEFRNKFLPREIQCWERLRHAHLVKLLHRDEVAGRVFFFMEYGDGGDMLAYVQKNGPVPEPTAALWMRQVTSGLTYMHRIGMVHRDLKLENIIIFHSTCVKIADFGFARRIGGDLSTTYCGSKSYSAPEILSGHPYNPYKADVWSLGVIAYVIVTDRMPFKDSMPNGEIVSAQRLRRYMYPPELALSANCKETIDMLMTFDANMRPDIYSSARLSWFLSHAPNPAGEATS